MKTKKSNVKKIDWKGLFTFKGKYLPYLLGVLVFIAIIFAVDKGYIPDALKVKKEVVKIKEVEKEVIKYIEKDGIPTYEFVTHFNPRVDPIIAKQIGESVNRYSKKYQLPRKLILSIIKKESFYNPFAKSKVAYGLMQVYPRFHKEKMAKRGISDERMLYHIDVNIDIGCEIFREYFDQTKGNLDETFHKYLSKTATKEQKDAYKNAILTSWARMEFMEYQRRNEIKEPVEDSTLEEEKTEEQGNEG